jgi:hypothetical protein
MSTESQNVTRFGEASETKGRDHVGGVSNHAISGAHPMPAADASASPT